MMEEPSVLDYLKARLTPWRGPAPEIPVGDVAREPAGVPEKAPARQGMAAGQPLAEAIGPDQPPEAGLAQGEAGRAETLAQQPLGRPATRAAADAHPAVVPYPAAGVVSVPWRSLLALGLALLAQNALEPKPERSWQTGVILYLLALAWLGVAFWREEWAVARADAPAGELPTGPSPAATSGARLIRHPAGLLLTLLLALAAFLASGGNRFTRLNLGLLVLSLALFLWVFWLPQASGRPWTARARALLARPGWGWTVTSWTLALLAAAALVVFFRVYRLAGVPPEMVSDHAEKLLDVGDVLAGQTSIFFPRNTGREAIQMYLTAAIARYLGTGLSFISLKIGTALAGLLTLPFIYLLGKEVGNRRVGLLALAFAGIAYWPNVIARVGLRFPFYPLFVAPVLYYLMRGLRNRRRNDFLLAGLFLGIGLHGYTPIRILPFVVLIAVGLYLVHRRAPGERREALVGLVLLAGVAVIAFLPLLRYMLENPDMFGYRAFSRLGSVERPLPGPAGLIFLKNLWNALIMFGWSDGAIWVHSVPYRPALDVVSAALFHLGTALLLLRYLRRRSWEEAFLLLSVPLLMLPSVLSLAFPDENPALNRAAGALVPVFVIVALSLDGLLNTLRKKLGASLGNTAAGALAVLLIFISANQNYDLVFRQYQQSYALASWNTSEMGQVIGDYARSFGSLDSAWVVAYPYWVDTRLVGVNAGNPLRDYAIWPDQLAGTQSIPGAKLFLVNPEDQASLDALRSLYPLGTAKQYTSRVENHNFWIFFVPSSQ